MNQPFSIFWQVILINNGLWSQRLDCSLYDLRQNIDYVHENSMSHNSLQCLFRRRASYLYIPPITYLRFVWEFSPNWSRFALSFSTTFGLNCYGGKCIFSVPFSNYFNSKNSVTSFYQRATDSEPLRLATLFKLTFCD